jgi:hypothetical protein
MVLTPALSISGHRSSMASPWGELRGRADVYSYRRRHAIQKHRKERDRGKESDRLRGTRPGTLPGFVGDDAEKDFRDYYLSWLHCWVFILARKYFVLQLHRHTKLIIIAA